MFSYNTSFHCSIQNTPSFLTCQSPPTRFTWPDLCQKFYGDSTQDDLTNHLLLAWDIAQKNNQAATTQTTEYTNQTMSLHPFQEVQLVLLDEHILCE